ncbi:MAG TPA: homocysteine S-methyltransferase family protein [Steroidobacteraceae bacterium]
MRAGPTLLDGGTGRELRRMGAPFRQPEWSALALMEAPEYVTRVHQHYLDAGADVITTNSYAVVPYHIGEARFRQQGFALAALSGRLARDAAGGAQRAVLVAGSLPPVCGSYRPDLFDAAVARPVLQELVRALDPFVDLWLAETVSSEAEMALMSEVVAARKQPWWVSYTLADEPAQRATARLRSGEPVAGAVTHAARLGAQAVLFNCCQPEAIATAVPAARAALDAFARTTGGDHVRVGAYANAFPPQRPTASANAELSTLRADLGPQDYLGWVRGWLADGAEIVGGCCGVGPEHIALMRTAIG